ncbi:MAG: hypothetical protein LKG25_01690 [Prevotella sp.]|nr:hypothetical protein [Prevotella sp.]MCI1281290.1 hypothetical protein [Prevotella sp.]
MKIKINYILSLAVILLVILCILSVCSPMRFQKEQDKRETAVKGYLVKIRFAEEQYLKKKGTYCNSLKALVDSGYMADSLQYIPFSGRKAFALSTTMMREKSGRQIPLMECSANMGDYLKGLDDNQVQNLINEANESGAFAGLKIGDTSTPNDNAGNWE